jgi:penicillin amidase
LAIRAVEYLAQHPNSLWFDDRTTSEVETANDIALRSYRQAIQFFRQQIGEILIDWQWGKIHKLTIPHLLGRKPPLSFKLNAGPFPVGGSADTINKQEYSLTEPFTAQVGPSVRIIVDLSQPEAAWFALPGGQSGQAFSEHYRDQLDLWLQGKYRKIPMLRDEIAATCKNVLILQPN